MAKLTVVERLTAARSRVRSWAKTGRTIEAAITAELHKQRTNYAKLAKLEAEGRKATRNLTRARSDVKRFVGRPSPPFSLKRGTVPSKRFFEPTGTAVEFKLDYDTGQRRSEAHLNVRLMKHDGARITLTEAKAATERFRHRGALLAGWEVRAIDWSTGKALRRGTMRGARGGDITGAIGDLRAVIAGAQLEFTPGLVEEG